MSAVLALAATGDTPLVDTELDLELEYGVPGAVWVPGYRLTYRQDGDDGRLVLRASVAQRTGEDWTGVRVAFATADLRRRTDLPVLRSIRIGRRQPAPAPSGWREPPRGLADLFADYDAARPRGEATAMAGAGPLGESVGGAVPPPPPSPGYEGAAAPVLPAPGGPSPAPPGRLPEPPRPARSRGAAGGRPRGFAPAAPTAPGRPAPESEPAAETAAGAPRPAAADLDYAALLLHGPEEPDTRRGLLRVGSPSDPVTAEYRRRAEAVSALPLPGHAVRPRESAGSFDHRFDARWTTDGRPGLHPGGEGPGLRPLRACRVAFGRQLRAGDDAGARVSRPARCAPER